jgi:hypothetical protein
MSCPDALFGLALELFQRRSRSCNEVADGRAGSAGGAAALDLPGSGIRPVKSNDSADGGFL